MEEERILRGWSLFGLEELGDDVEGLAGAK